MAVQASVQHDSNECQRALWVSQAVQSCSLPPVPIDLRSNILQEEGDVVDEIINSLQAGTEVL